MIDPLKQFNIANKKSELPGKKAGEVSSSAKKEPPSENRTADIFKLAGKGAVDLTPYGKLPVIITKKGNPDLNEIKSRIVKGFKAEEASIKEELSIINGMKVEVDPFNFEKLMKNIPPDSKVILDQNIPFILLEKPSNPADLDKRPSFDVSNSTLGLNRLWEKGYTGKGVGICVIDSGIYPHKDFEGRIKAFVDMHDKKEKLHDPIGHGTHVASIALGSGVESAGKYKGVAPEADLLGVRVTNQSEAIKGIQWAIENKDKYNIRVINLSLGVDSQASLEDDPFAQAAEKAWEKGLVVCVAAGNEGPNPGSISSPGVSPSVITVGNLDDKNTPERDDDTIYNDSSRGPTRFDNIAKPDLVAPGTNIYGALAPDCLMYDPKLPNHEGKYMAVSGTSQATPIVSGLAALLIQANPGLSNMEIKEILMNTSDKYLSDDKNTQGAGLVDPLEALENALEKADAKNET
ncbi:MAG: S8 family peptidase [Vulcanimicrobiota bacterium]